MEAPRCPGCPLSGGGVQVSPLCFPSGGLGVGSKGGALEDKSGMQGLLLSSCATLGKSPPLSGLQFPHL